MCGTSASIAYSSSGRAYRGLTILTAIFISYAPFRTFSLHEPAVADDDRLSRQRVGGKRGEEERRLGDVLDRGELAVNGLLQHHVLHDLLLGDAEVARLLGDLLVDERRAHE